MKPGENVTFSALGIRAAVLRAEYRKGLLAELSSIRRNLKPRKVKKLDPEEQSQVKERLNKRIRQIRRELREHPVSYIHKRLGESPELWTGRVPRIGDISTALDRIDDKSQKLLQAVEELRVSDYYAVQRLVEGLVGKKGAPKHQFLAEAHARRDAIVDAKQWGPAQPILGQLLPKDKNAPRIMVPDSEVSSEQRHFYKPNPRPGEPLFPRLAMAYQAVVDGDSLEPFAKVMDMRSDMLAQNMRNPSQGRAVQRMKGALHPSSHKPPTDPDTWDRSVKVLRDNPVRTPFGIYRLNKKWRLRPMTEPLIRFLLEERVANNDRGALRNENVKKFRVSSQTLVRIWSDERYREACKESGDTELLDLWNDAQTMSLRHRIHRREELAIPA